MSLPADVGTPIYREGMSERGVSELLTTIMVVGDVGGLDVRDHRLAHAALTRLRGSEEGMCVLQAFHVRLDWKPDPEVGLRVPGVTSALWHATNLGRLRVTTDEKQTRFVLSPSEVESARGRLTQLPSQLAEEIFRTATFWADSSTSRKNRANASRSAVGTRRAKLA